jgi:hypothetical protein
MRELNDKPGFIVNREDDRWGVVMLELDDGEPGVRKIWKIRSENLKALASFKCLKITPVGDSNIANVKMEQFNDLLLVYGRHFGKV